MATVAAALVNVLEASHKVFVASWAAMANGDVGEAVPLSQYSDRSVQVTGTLAGASVTLEGSLDGTTYAPLTDPQGNNLLITSPKIEMITELVRYVRPVISSGAGASVTVLLLLRIT